MKKRMLKNLTAALIVMAMVFAFASCSDGGGETNEQTEQTTVETQAETEVQPTDNVVVDVVEPEVEDIGYDAVKSIVIDKVPGSTESNIYELEREYDDGMLQYEGSLYYGGYEYEFEINGKTGAILQWEIDD